MAVTELIIALADHLDGVLAGNPSIGAVQPVANGDLPTVTFSLTEVEPTMPAVGRVPAPVRSGALQVDTSIDLADPVLHLPGEDVALLSPDRRLFQLPHGGIVRADGGDVSPFAVGDLLIRRGGTTFTPVTGTPTGNQCRPDPVTGAVTFGQPLPDTGTLTLRYFVGTWEVAVERYAGVLVADVHASPGDVMSLSDQVVLRLGTGQGIPGVRRLDLAAVSAAVPGGFGNARRRSLTYRFDYEREEAAIQTSGGPIRSVAVDAHTNIDPSGTSTESFTVLHEP